MTRVGLFAFLVLVQLACATFFAWEILASLFGIEIRPISWALYELFEIGAVLGLFCGTFLTAWMLYRSLREREAAVADLRLASGAFMEVVDERFAEWHLTKAERDVALFSIKGLSTAEIADLRNTSEGTVKAQTNAIYRKAGVTGRAQLLSLFLDALMEDSLPGVGERAAAAEMSDNVKLAAQ